MTPPKRNHIAITPLLFYNLLQCKAHAPILRHDGNKVTMEIAKIPGTSIPLNGDSVDGFILHNIIKQALPLIDGPLLEITMRLE